MFSTPILLIIFNRPQLTELVFNSIRYIKPSRLFVAADGPRTEQERSITSITRSIIQVDWDCEVSYNYSNVNLGCGLRPSTAISWAFEEVEELIILEDDCLPDHTFFKFCASLLDYYRNDHRVGTINGTTIPRSANHIHSSYYFSRFSVIWGWATWKRVWKNYDYYLGDWDQLKNSNWLMNAFSGNISMGLGFAHMFNTVKNGWDVWDAQLFYLCLKNNYLNIHPTFNLVKNMGFDGSGTHTHQQNADYANMPTTKLVQLMHPHTMAFDHFADLVIFETLYGDKKPRTILNKIENRISNFWQILFGIK